MLRMNVVVVDLGASNIASMVFALERLGARPRVTADHAAIGEAERLILPGVGSAAFVMERLRAKGLEPVLKAFARPLLGVCLGQQLLHEASAEGPTPCLGLLPGSVEPLEAAPDRPVPHMGWNRLAELAAHPLLDGIAEGAHVYFVHSFAATVSPATIARADYGRPFAAIEAKGNVMGTQFHPERSSSVGARLLANFLALPC